jgi:hypothetical protein
MPSSGSALNHSPSPILVLHADDGRALAQDAAGALRTLLAAVR